MLLKEPFYAHFLSGIIREVTDKVPTAAVGFKTGKIALYVNENFFLKELKSVNERVAVIKHETLHIIFKHLFRMKTKSYDNQLFNKTTITHKYFQATLLFFKNKFRKALSTVCVTFILKHRGYSEPMFLYSF